MNTPSLTVTPRSRCRKGRSDCAPGACRAMACKIRLNAPRRKDFFIGKAGEMNSTNSNPLDECAAPGKTHAEPDEHEAVAGADFSGLQSPLERDWNGAGNRVSHVVHRHPKLLGGQPQFLPEVLQHELGCLVEDEQVDVFHPYLGQRQ